MNKNTNISKIIRSAYIVKYKICITVYVTEDGFSVSFLSLQPIRFST